MKTNTLHQSRLEACAIAKNITVLLYDHLRIVSNSLIKNVEQWCLDNPKLNYQSNAAFIKPVNEAILEYESNIKPNDISLQVMDAIICVNDHDNCLTNLLNKIEVFNKI